jgi:sugar-specific transcriptional regulator TrmB
VTEREVLIADLVSAGLARNEALAWLTLLENPEELGLTGYEVAARSAIPRSAVYTVLRKLESAGAAFQIGSDPARFAPTAPDLWVAEQRRQALQRLSAVADGLSALPKRTRPEPIWIVNAYDDVLAKAADMIRGAETAIYLSAWPRELSILAPALAQGPDRSMHRILHVPAALAEPLAGFRCWADDLADQGPRSAWAHKLIVVVDQSQALIGGAERGANNQAVWTRNPSLVDVATNHIILDVTLLARRTGRDCSADVGPMIRPKLA